MIGFGESESAPPESRAYAFAGDYGQDASHSTGQAPKIGEPELNAKSVDMQHGEGSAATGPRTHGDEPKQP